jgi:hypothetical protein
MSSISSRTLSAKNTSPGFTIASGQTVLFDTVDPAQSGISYNSSTGVFTLPQGKWSVRAKLGRFVSAPPLEFAEVPYTLVNSDTNGALAIYAQGIYSNPVLGLVLTTSDTMVTDVRVAQGSTQNVALQVGSITFIPTPAPLSVTELGNASAYISFEKVE